MRAMWTAASGMKSLQLSVDTISHNLANVNTTGFKKIRTEFKDLLYVKLKNNEKIDGEVGAPVDLQIGHGVIPGANVKSFTQGALQRTDSIFDFAIEGEGFFEIEDVNGNLFYTRDGSFKLGLSEGGQSLLTSDGYYVQGEDGRINITGDVDDISVDTNGVVRVKYSDSEEGVYEEVGQIKLVKIANPQGLAAKGMNLYAVTTASGPALNLDDGEAGNIRQGVLEMSNVQVVDEMVNLITAQRAYEINSKAIQTADQMLELANNLKR